MRICVAATLSAAALVLVMSANARAASAASAAPTCPPIADKPGAIAHVEYNGVEHITYCDGPIKIQPGQNIIRLNKSDLFPSKPGYITRFDPELVYRDGTVPRVDILHLHHAVWIVNGQPQFATGEEKTIVQLPRGFGWRTRPTDSWFVNDMLHDLVGKAAHVYIVWRIDFVPDSSPAAASMHTVHTRWMDVSGPSPGVGISRPIYPVFDALRGMGKNGRYTFPDQAVGHQRAFIGRNQTWTPSHPVTLIGTAGHLHPGGLNTTLTDKRGDQKTTLFTSRAHYYEPAGEVSWDVAMGATPRSWRVKLAAGDTLGVHATYDTGRADWYDVMGIMPVAVYDGTDVGGQDAFAGNIPQNGVLTHGHLAENRHHGGGPAGLPDPLKLPDGPLFSPTSKPVDIQGYTYGQGDLYSRGAAANPPTVHAGQSLTFKNLDSVPSVNTFHTITGCKDPCNRDTGVAYPVADGSVSFDSGQLGYNKVAGFGAPAADRITWQTPKNLKPGTYSYFCRIHPFMRGSFRVINR